jgi:hypothetical protein
MTMRHAFLAAAFALAAGIADQSAFAQQTPAAPGAQPPGPGTPGAAKGPAPAGGPGKGPTARQSQLYGDELFTPEERKAFFDQMKAAKTPEERAKIQAERRTTAEARAKEKGITLPEPRPRAPGGPGQGPAPSAPKAQ